MYFSNSCALINKKSYKLESGFTGAEDEIFSYMERMSGQIINKEKACKDLGFDSPLISRAFDMHVSNINKKLTRSEIPFRIFSRRAKGVVLSSVEEI